MRQTLILLCLVAVGAALLPPARAEGEGQSLYEAKCAICHGKDGVAKKMAKGSANFNDPEWQKTATPEEIVKVSLEGKGKMPKFEGKLTEAELRQIAEYIKTLK